MAAKAGVWWRDTSWRVMLYARVPACSQDGWGLSPVQTGDGVTVVAAGSGWMSRNTRSSSLPTDRARSMVRPSGSLSTVPPSVYQNLPSAGNPSRPAWT